MPFTQTPHLPQVDPLLIDHPDNVLLPVEKYIEMKETIMDWQIGWQQVKD